MRKLFSPDVFKKISGASPPVEQASLRKITREGRGDTSGSTPQATPEQQSGEQAAQDGKAPSNQVSKRASLLSATSDIRDVKTGRASLLGSR